MAQHAWFSLSGRLLPCLPCETCHDMSPPASTNFGTLSRLGPGPLERMRVKADFTVPYPSHSSKPGLGRSGKANRR